VEQLPYSELKQRIAAGQVASVRLGETSIEATPADSIRAASPAKVWTAIRVEDETLVPLLEERGVPFEGTMRGWLSQALGWLLPHGLIILFWVWMLRRMNPTQVHRGKAFRSSCPGRVRWWIRLR
jgi:cell division protease FtsH